MPNTSAKNCNACVSECSFHLHSSTPNYPQISPIEYRDLVIFGLDKCRGKLEASWQFLQRSATKVEHRKLGQELLEILLVGGLIDCNGKYVSANGTKSRAIYCLASPKNNLVIERNYEQLISRLVKRYRHLAIALEPEIKKLVKLIYRFDHVTVQKLAHCTGVCLVENTLPARALEVLLNKDLIRDGTSLEFLIEVFKTLKSRLSATSLMRAIKKTGLDTKLLSIMPPSKRNELNLANTYLENDLVEVVRLHQTCLCQELRLQLYQMLMDDFKEEIPEDDILRKTKQFMEETSLAEEDVLATMWTVLISQGEWARTGVSITEQAVNLMKGFCPLLSNFNSKEQSQIKLIEKIQNYCQENPKFVDTFGSLVLLFYKQQIVDDTAIIIWYKTNIGQRSKTVYVSQIQKLHQWIQSEPNPEKRKYCKDFSRTERPKTHFSIPEVHK